MQQATLSSVDGIQLDQAWRRAVSWDSENSKVGLADGIAVTGEPAVESGK